MIKKVTTWGMYLNNSVNMHPNRVNCTTQLYSLYFLLIGLGSTRLV